MLRRFGNTVDEAKCIKIMADALSGNQNLIFIDLSDTENYPHKKTNKIFWQGIDAEITIHNKAKYRFRWGILTKVTVPQTRVVWFIDWKIESRNVQGFTFTRHDFPPAWIDLGVRDNIRTNGLLGSFQDITGFSPNDVINTLGGQNVAPERGDMILQVTQLSGNSTYEVDLNVYYNTADDWQ